MSPTATFGTYLIGAIFAIGGVLFMLLLDSKGLLFGIPYVVIGLVLIYGAYGAARRRKRQLAASEEGSGSPPGSGTSAT